MLRWLFIHPSLMPQKGRTMFRLLLSILGSAIVLGVGLSTLEVGAQDQGSADVSSATGGEPRERPALFGPLTFGGDETPALAEMGLQIALGGSSAGGFGMTCVACHGRDGQGSARSGIPRIAGQSAEYLQRQLEDYAAGTRPSYVMAGVAERLMDVERRAVSAFYASLDPSRDDEPAPSDPAVLQRGGQLFAVGSPDGAITACVMCHLPGADGSGPAVPYIAGQHARYVADQLQLWQEGRRSNDPLNVMATIAQHMTDADIAAVSAYLATRQPPGSNAGATLDPDVDIDAEGK
ncbi:hypothetical protein A8B78_11990 [Jannaschia sp. EhC01]|nr:hypothetical protein A8B78_11990 [Jannaschia sp. EhC01]